ncbi:glycosyltransferase family 4 protein [Candidatus Peribacteria bacterium]|nr:MAG: glycosyltransferase family 4 protein [Candidatus Peribacteria bacterium]
MHIGIDVREACALHRTGKGQWTFGFVSELLIRDAEMTLYTDAPLPESWLNIIDKKKTVHVVTIETKGLFWHWRAALHFLQHDAIHAYVSTVSYIVPWIVGRRKKVIPVVHDLIAFQNEPHDARATFIEKMTLRRTVFSATRICTVSASTMKDLLNRYPKLPDANIIPVFAGPMTNDTSDNRADGKTILCIATLCPRKNQLRLIAAFASLPGHLRASHRLVLVGKRGWDDEEIVRRASTTPNVEWKQYLPDDACETLFRSATVFAFPSLYEGFGMPVLDAFRHGVPVLTSDRGSLKEVAGSAALLINPESVESIRHGLEKILTDADLRHSLREKGKKQAEEFSWKRTVDLFLAAL